MATTAYFSKIKDELIINLGRARQEIKAAVAWITDEDIIRVLTQKASKGLDVQVVISDSIENFRALSKFKAYIQAGGKLHVVSPKFLHHKFCIIDQEIIISGSYNWTYYARNNEENILVIELDKFLQSDQRLLDSFVAKHAFFCNKVSIFITDVAQLKAFQSQGKDVSRHLSEIDLEEMKLREELEEDVKRSFETAKSLNIGVSDYLLERMKIDGGGAQFIKRILYDEMSTGEMKSGFRKLEQPIPHRVDLSLEYIASRPKYQKLFEPNLVAFCMTLMKKYNLE